MLKALGASLGRRDALINFVGLSAKGEPRWNADLVQLSGRVGGCRKPRASPRRTGPQRGKKRRKFLARSIFSAIPLVLKDGLTTDMPPAEISHRREQPSFLTVEEIGRA